MFGIRPRFVRQYRRLVKTMLRRHDTVEAALLHSIGGGGYDEVGQMELSVLRNAGLTDSSYLIDVGCGVGRLAATLRQCPHVKFLGIDVVPELIHFACTKCDRPDWRFEVVDGLRIPEDDDKAEFVSFFSVLTHLTAAECLAYLREAQRVAKPGGRIVASYLDRHLEPHRAAAGEWFSQALYRLRGQAVKNSLWDRETMLDFGRQLNLKTEFMASPFVQHMCVYTKPVPAETPSTI